PDIALVDDTHISCCWVFQGEDRQLRLKLSMLIYPTHVTIDHIPMEVAMDISTAPRQMVLWGAVD
ncbi:hypothetical protein GY45DRAFT_1218561, partial [Cubamyces sp. BRFM 1775]